MLDEPFHHTGFEEQGDLPIIGFKTAQGSLYRYDPESCTSQRFKVSFGSGQGQTDHQGLCFFLTDEQRDSLQTNFHYQQKKYRYRFGWTKDGKTGLFNGNEIDAPEGADICLYIYDREGKKYVFGLQ